MRSKIFLAVLAVSLVVHGFLAVGLMAAANHRVESRRRAIAVEVAEKKKAKAAPKPEPKPTPKPAPRKVASIPRETAAPVVAPKLSAPRAAPIAMPIQMSNTPAVEEDNSPGGIVIPVARPAAAARPAAVRTMASMGPDGRKRLKAEPGSSGGPTGEADCAEEPSKPEPVFKTDIEYTAQARAEGIEGKLKLKLTVARDGSVVQVDVMSGVSPELDAAAVEAAKKWRFKPAMACGRPVDGGTYILARKFELGD